MNLPKKFLFLLFSAFLLLQSFNLLERFLGTAFEPINLIQSFLLALILNIYIIGIFAFPGFVLPTHKIFPASYFKLKNPELLKKLYKSFKVEGFRKLLMRFFWGKKDNRKKYFDGTRSGFENFIYQSKQSEIGHLLPLVFLSIISYALIFKGYFWMGFITLVINFIGNFYPVILQRHHRIRIEKIMARYLK